MKITMAHGSGGAATSELINNIFAKKFSNDVLCQLGDCAIVEGNAKLAMTTDSFVVNPVIYKGGDIGRLAICGTVNDLLAGGAIPQYITCGFILEEGLDIEVLDKITDSMALTAKEAGVIIVAGDTKVVEGDGGLYINTAGVGFVEEAVDVAAKNCRPGDKIILSGNLGDHHATILSTRMEIDSNIESDNAPLVEMVKSLLSKKIVPHAMRDVTRGGLGTILCELAEDSKCSFEIDESTIPVSREVDGFRKILGLDLMHMGNEGKMLFVIPKEQALAALEIIASSKYGENAAVIGEVKQGEGVTMLTRLGGKRTIKPLIGEGLPRIC